MTEHKHSDAELSELHTKVTGWLAELTEAADRYDADDVGFHIRKITRTRGELHDLAEGIGRELAERAQQRGKAAQEKRKAKAAK